MLNAEVYLKNPKTTELVNKGVANVNDDQSREAINALRYELETFVCEGRYKEGLERVLGNFLRNIGKSDQPGVWVSGFYGSGKSHFVKMLRALWTDIKFADNATARGIANLPQETRDLLTELTNAGRKFGGLRAASGTLGAGKSGSVRLALLGIVFKSAGLPEHWMQAQFSLWLKKENIYEEVRAHVEKRGADWTEELINFTISGPILEKLVELRPAIFPNTARCGQALENQFREVEDVSSAEMVQTIERTLTQNGKFPLTLIVLDEVQQFIGTDGQRALDIQEAVEACGKSFGGKLLFVGTGQTGISGTKDLKKLEGRFTLRVELSDADVDYVIRKVILAKKPEANAELQNVFQANRGEISRHLAGTGLQHAQEDERVFAQDYPLLPTRRRLWENILRAVDLSGTDSQLRNQLSMTHNVIQTNLDLPLGNVIGADYIYFDSADKLLQTGTLPRNVHSQTMQWHHGENADDKLLARACGLVFLLNKLKANEDLKIRVDVDTLADLLVEDLAAGSAALRAKLPALLDNCPLLMAVDDGAGTREYRIQTPESSAWRDEFKARMSSLDNNSRIVSDTREQRLQAAFMKALGKLAILHGNSKVSRDASFVFNSSLPADSAKKVYVSVADGWNSSENSLKSDAAQAGPQSPAIFVYLPKIHEDQLRDNILKMTAAEQTLNARGATDTPEGREARAYIESLKTDAEMAVNQALQRIIAGAIALQGGGQAISGNNLGEMLKEAFNNSLVRLYPNFAIADNPAWAKVYEKAKKGAGDALKAVGDNGDAPNNAVCKNILAFIGNGKSGAEIRAHFEAAPFGWPQDAVDGALQVLLVAGLVKALDERGNSVDPIALERKNLAKASFRIQAVTINAKQRLDIRKLYAKAGLHCEPDGESFMAGQFLDKMSSLAQSAGGDAPKPLLPDAALLGQIRHESGNEQLKAIHDARQTLAANLEEWSEKAAKIASRWPEWQQLEQLAKFAKDLPGAEELLKRLEALRAQRQLLAEPDPVAPLLADMARILRDELNRLQKAYQEGHAAGMEQLRQDANWNKLQPEQKNALLAENRLTGQSQPQIAVGDAEEILATLRRHSLPALESEIAALPKRFGDAARSAAEIFAPDTQYVSLPRRTLATDDDIDAWLAETEKLLREALRNGPVVAR